MNMLETLSNLDIHRRCLDGSFGRELVKGLSNALALIARNQKIISAGDPGCIPDEGHPPSKDAVRSYTLALMVELAEFIQELDWKPWKDKQINAERVADEFADILAFMGILIVYLDRMGIPPGMLARQYREKSKVNIDRFISRHSITAPVADNWKQGTLFDMEGLK